MSSFQTALSGLQAASTDLQVMGNNISNANTVGFKESNVHFGDAYASAIAGSAPINGQIGIGTSVESIAQQFSQGNITSTNNPLDVAVNGAGFYQFLFNGATVYGRNGQFALDSQGYIVDSAGGKLIGTTAVSGTLTGAMGPLQVNQATLAPQATSGMTITLNLNAATTPVASGTAFNPNDSTTYNFTTVTSVYDSLGTSHMLTTYYQLSSGAGGASGSSGNQWNVYYGLSGTSSVSGTAATSGTTYGSLGTLPFTSTGAVSGTFSGTISNIAWTDGATNSNITYNYAGSTNYNSANAVTAIQDNGYGVGQLSNLSINDTGIVYGVYSNGQSSVLGQIMLTNFAAPQELQRAGNNYFVSTRQSGPPLTGTPGSGGLGLLQSSAIEQSNVDLSTQLVSLITAQQAYQANAQTIKTEQSVVQTLLQL